MYRLLIYPITEPVSPLMVKKHVPRSNKSDDFEIFFYIYCNKSNFKKVRGV
jgi:hypothetical protein